MSKKNRATLNVLVIVLLDIIVIGICCGLAFLVRFDFSIGEIPAQYRVLMGRFLCLQSVLMLLIFYLRKMYSYIWHSVSIYDVSIDGVGIVIVEYLRHADLCKVLVCI